MSWVKKFKILRYLALLTRHKCKKKTNQRTRKITFSRLKLYSTRFVHNPQNRFTKARYIYLN